MKKHAYLTSVTLVPHRERSALATSTFVTLNALRPVGVALTVLTAVRAGHIEISRLTLVTLPSNDERSTFTMPRTVIARLTDRPDRITVARFATLR